MEAVVAMSARRERRGHNCFLRKRKMKSPKTTFGRQGTMNLLFVLEMEKNKSQSLRSLVFSSLELHHYVAGILASHTRQLLSRKRDVVATILVIQEVSRHLELEDSNVKASKKLADFFWHSSNVTICSSVYLVTDWKHWMPSWEEAFVAVVVVVVVVSSYSWQRLQKNKHLLIHRYNVS